MIQSIVGNQLFPWHLILTPPLPNSSDSDSNSSQNTALGEAILLGAILDSFSEFQDPPSFLNFVNSSQSLGQNLNLQV